MPAAMKTPTDQLADAEELIRRKNADLVHLNRQLKELRRENDTAEKIREEIYNLAARSPEPPAWANGKGGHSGSRGAPMTIWSDWHYGEVVNPDEIGGMNKFNPQIAKNRVFRLVNTTIDLAYNHMGHGKAEYPGMVICLGGDMLTGDIHEELANTNSRTSMQCVNDLTDILAAAIEKMATGFGRVFLPCVVGNHGRSTHKPRMKGRVYTNYDWLIYCNLERHFRSSKNVQFLIPPEIDAYFKVFGHRYLLTHGDSLGVRGGDGIIGAVGPIMRGTFKVGQSEAQIGREFDTLLIGHWHTYMPLPRVIVNGALKGYDEYARVGLRIPFALPSQALWFSHPEWGITAHWQVYLEGKKKAQEHTQWVTWENRYVA